MRRFSLLFFLFVSLSAFSQMAYEQYDISSGFPTNQFYEVFEDSRGYIWALSDNGIFRFNGEGFEKIEIEASLGTSIPIDVIEDKRGLFVLFLDGRIGCYAYPESLIKAHHLNDEIQRKINSERKAYREQNAVNNSFRSVGDTVLVFSSYGDGIICIRSNEIVRHDFDQRVRVGVHECFGKNQVLSLDGKEIRKRVENDLFNFNGITYNVMEIAGFKMSTGANVFVLDRKENVFVSVGTGLMRFKNGQLVSNEEFGRFINAIDSLENGTFLIHLNGARTKVYDFRMKKSSDWEIPFESITRTIVDRNGGRWISTLFDGVMYFPNSDMKIVKGTEDESINALFAHKQKVYAGTPFGTIIEYDLRRQTAEKTKVKGASELRDFVFFEDELMGFSLNGIINIKQKVFNSINPRKTISDFSLKKDMLFLSNAEGVFQYKKGAFEVDPSFREEGSHFVKSERLQQIDRICSYKDDIICSFRNELFLYDVPRMKRGKTILSMSSNIRQIRSHGGYIYFVTKEGLFRWNWDKSDDPSLVLASSKFRINEIYFHNNNLFVGASNGIYHFDSYENGRTLIRHFDQNIGLTDVNIRRIVICADQLFLGTHSGLFQLPLDKLKLIEEAPKIYIKSVNNGSTAIDFGVKGVFPSGKNSVRISTDLLAFKGRSDIDIYYRLRKDQEWTKTDKTEFEFPFLPHGEYTFQLKAKSGSHWSAPQEYAFEISPAFWQRTDVFVFFILLIIGSVVLIVIFRIRKLSREKAASDKIVELNKRASDLKQQALKAQINPHFMSNALGSIQSFIRKNDAERSDRYLNDFGHLMRLVLESSTEPTLEIEKEIKLLSSYIRLEQLRANFSFEFEVKCDDSLLDEGIKIPSMILQPLIENAILHGVSGVNDGKITLSFEDKEKVIVCKIEDNGIGYLEHSKRKREREYKSRAMSIVKDRLEILNSQDTDDIIFTDLSVVGKKGTQVKLCLPVFY